LLAWDERCYVAQDVRQVRLKGCRRHLRDQECKEIADVAAPLPGRIHRTRATLEWLKNAATEVDKHATRAASDGFKERECDIWQCFVGLSDERRRIDQTPPGCERLCRTMRTGG
jgi:hypothetical protein